MKNRFLKSAAALLSAAAMLITPLTSAAYSPASFYTATGKTVSVFNFDDEVSAWRTTYNHTIDSTEKNEGDSSYCVSYDKDIDSHKALYSDKGAFTINVKDVTLTTMSIDIYVSDTAKLGSMRASGKYVALTLTDANGFELKWYLAVTNGWNKLEFSLTDCENSLDDFIKFNFNKINGMYVTVGKASSGLELRFDDYKLINYTRSKNVTAAPYKGRRIACFEKTSPEGLHLNDLPAMVGFNAEKVSQGKTALSITASEADSDPMIRIGGLSVAATIEKDVLFFDVYVSKASVLACNAEIVLSNGTSKKLSIKSTDGFAKYANPVIVKAEPPVSSDTSSTEEKSEKAAAKAVTPAAESTTSGSSNENKDKETAKPGVIKDGLNTFAIPLADMTVTGIKEKTFELCEFSIYYSCKNDSTWQIDDVFLTTSENLTKYDKTELGELKASAGAAVATLNYVNPLGTTISNVKADLITGTTATLYMTVTGGYEIFSAGFRWGETSYKLTNEIKIDPSFMIDGVATVDLAGLQKEKTYYFRPYVVTEKGETQGELTSFKTLSSLAVTTRASEGGIVSPLGVTTVEHGDTLTVMITPETGYYLRVLAIDGQETVYTEDTQIGEYTFTDITEGHTLYAVFEKIPVESVIDAITSTPQDTSSIDRDKLMKFLVKFVIIIAVLAFVAAMMLPLLSIFHKKKKPVTPPPVPTAGGTDNDFRSNGFKLKDEPEDF